MLRSFQRRQFSGRCFILDLFIVMELLMCTVYSTHANAYDCIGCDSFQGLNPLRHFSEYDGISSGSGYDVPRHLKVFNPNPGNTIMHNSRISSVQTFEGLHHPVNGFGMNNLGQVCDNPLLCQSKIFSSIPSGGFGGTAGLPTQIDLSQNIPKSPLPPFYPTAPNRTQGQIILPFHPSFSSVQSNNQRLDVFQNNHQFCPQHQGVNNNLQIPIETLIWPGLLKQLLNTLDKNKLLEGSQVTPVQNNITNQQDQMLGQNATPQNTNINAQVLPSIDLSMYYKPNTGRSSSDEDEEPKSNQSATQLESKTQSGERSLRNRNRMFYPSTDPLDNRFNMRTFPDPMLRDLQKSYENIYNVNQLPSSLLNSNIEFPRTNPYSNLYYPLNSIPPNFLYSPIYKPSRSLWPSPQLAQDNTSSTIYDYPFVYRFRNVLYNPFLENQNIVRNNKRYPNILPRLESLQPVLANINKIQDVRPIIQPPIPPNKPSVAQNTQTDQLSSPMEIKTKLATRQMPGTPTPMRLYPVLQSRYYA